MKRIQEEGRVPLYPSLPLATPFVINVDPSSLCNFRCQFCFHRDRTTLLKQRTMLWDTYTKIISDIKEFPNKLKTLRLYAFGEPLLNHKFEDMIKLAKDTNICEKVDTTTNGSLFSPKRNIEIINAGIDRINISVEGVTKEHYKKFSKYNIDFNKYVDNIAHLYENKRNCVIFIKINGDLITQEEQQKFLEIFTPISDGIAIEHVMNCWYDFNLGEIEVNKEVGVYGQPLTYVEVCPYIFYSFCIQSDGLASACFLDWNNKLVIGDTSKESVVSIWNGTTLNNLRKLMLTKKRNSHQICKNCNQLIAGQPENLDSYIEDLLGKY